MTTLREAAQQALEALEWHYRQGHSNTLGGFRLKIDEKALRELSAALAQQAEPVEPVAWALDGTSVVEFDRQTYHNGPEWTPLCKCADTPPQRKPLTEKEMYIVEEEARKNFRLAQAGPRGQMITYWDSLTPWLIRAVERAHGIKE